MRTEKTCEDIDPRVLCQISKPPVKALLEGVLVAGILKYFFAITNKLG